MSNQNCETQIEKKTIFSYKNNNKKKQFVYKLFNNLYQSKKLHFERTRSCVFLGLANNNNTKVYTINNNLVQNIIYFRID